MFILLLILILSTSLFTFNAATSSVTESMNNLNPIEIQAFNEPIIQYEGRQMGSQVKSLLGTLIVNAGNNQDFDDVAFPLVELGWEIGAMINPIVYSLGDWKKREFTPFYNNVKQDGVLLWH